MGMLDSIFGGGGADVPEYKPYSGTSGLGSIDIKDQRAEVTLDPRYQAIVNQLLGGIGGLQPSLSEEQLALGGMATEKGAGFLQGLSTDPFDATEKQFQRMESILEPGRERARTATQERLLATGRLGSTGGARSEAALEEAIEQSRRENLAGAFGLAQQAQAQQAGIGQQLGAFGLGQEQAQLQRLLQSLGAAQATEALPLELGSYLSALSGQRSQHQLGAAQLAGESGGFGDVLGGALSAGIGAYTKGIGTKWSTQ